MNKRIQKSIFFILAITVFLSCSNNSSQGIKKSITGSPGEMVVVISENLWKASTGELIRSTIGQPQLSLPQEEPIFDLVDIPHKAFDSMFKTTRNLLITNISSMVENPGVDFKDNVWANPQATVEIRAKSVDEFKTLFNKNSDKIIAYFLKAEKSRLQMNYRKIHDKGVLNKLQQKFDITMYALPGFKLATEKDDFIWYRYDTPEIMQGIFVYSLPYTTDSIFTRDYLIGKRNLMLKKYVPGPTEGSYMSTEMQLDPTFNIFEHHGNYAAEIRGLWRTENDFMGGPYIMLAELDAASQRVVVAEGFVYAPSKEKRNYLRQVEAMIYSMKFGDQEKNDKINSQMKMGN